MLMHLAQIIVVIDINMIVRVRSLDAQREKRGTIVDQLRQPSLGGGGEELLGSVGLVEELVGWALDDAACDGELRADACEEGVDVAGAHAAFVDTPVAY